MKKRSISQVSLLLLGLAAFLLTMSSCYFAGMTLATLLGPAKYTGSYPELYTVAVNNVFGADGYASNGEVIYEAEIRVLEKDAYGRVLFVYDECNDDYCDNCGSGNPCYGIAYCIAQRSDGKYAWFYQDACYQPDFFRDGDLPLDQLKRRNDWEQPLDLGKCTKAPYTDQRPESPMQVDEEVFNKAIYTYLMGRGYSGYDDDPVYYTTFCNADAKGNELHYVMCLIQLDEDPNKGFLWREFAVIVRADGTIAQHGLREVLQPDDAYSVVQKLKELNNWAFLQ